MDPCFEQGATAFTELLGNSQALLLLFSQKPFLSMDFDFIGGNARDGGHAFRGTPHIRMALLEGGGAAPSCLVAKPPLISSCD